MTDISENSVPDKIPLAAQSDLASRLADIRAELAATIRAPYAFGREGPHRRKRDVDILSSIAADLNARIEHARAAR